MFFGTNDKLPFNDYTAVMIATMVSLMPLVLVQDQPKDIDSMCTFHIIIIINNNVTHKKNDYTTPTKKCKIASEMLSNAELVCTLYSHD